jgi:hypothetical protein
MRSDAGGREAPKIGRVDWVVAGLALVAVGLLYHRVPGMWWSADDPMVLWHVSRFGAAYYFFDPAVWRSFNPTILHPWMLLSFDVDWSMFGLGPAGFYLHQLLALAVASAALWVCLRLYVAPAAAGIGAVGLLVAPATAEIASNLSTRPYVEGLVFACLSFAFFVVSLRKSSGGPNLLAAGFFALALTSKEIFAPLPVVLFLLPEGDLRQRLRRLTPFALVVVVYVAWRHRMLGSFGGGYRARVLPSGAEVASWLQSVAQSNGLSIGFLTLAVLAVLVGSAVVLGRCPPTWRWFWLGFAICVVLPVVPVVHVFSARHAFAVAVLVASAAAALADRLIEARIGTLGRWSVGAVGVVVLVAVGSDARSRLPSIDQVRRVRTEGEEILRGGDPDLAVVSPLMPYWHFFGLVHLRGEVLGLPAGPGVLTDACYAEIVSSREPPGRRRLLTYDPAVGRLVAMPAPDTPCVVVDDAELTVSIRFDPATNLTSWRLGPYEDGRYTVLWAIADGSLVGIDVPPAGHWRGNVAFEMGVDLVVAYRSPEGWRTVTPRLAAGPVSGEIGIGWSREPAPPDHSDPPPDASEEP